MLTFSGRHIDEHRGAPSLLDLAVQLGREGRWCGAGRVFFPVLLHEMAVADLLPLKIQIHGLLHDSDETLTGDVPSPMKTEAMRRIQQAFRLRVYAEMGIKPPDDKTVALVKAADLRIRVGEAHVIGPQNAASAKEFLPRDRDAEKIVSFYASRYRYEDYLEPGGRAISDYMKRVIASKG